MDNAEIAERLYDAANSRAKNRGFEIQPQAASDIRKHASSAATKIRARAKETGAPLEGLIGTGELSFEKLIDEMISVAKGIKGYPPGKLGEQTFHGALSALCPFWPLC